MESSTSHCVWMDNTRTTHHNSHILSGLLLPVTYLHVDIRLSNIFPGLSVRSAHRSFHISSSQATLRGCTHDEVRPLFEFKFEPTFRAGMCTHHNPSVSGVNRPQTRSIGCSTTLREIRFRSIIDDGHYVRPRPSRVHNKNRAARFGMIFGPLSLLQLLLSRQLEHSLSWSHTSAASQGLVVDGDLVPADRRQNQSTDERSSRRATRGDSHPTPASSYVRNAIVLNSGSTARAWTVVS